MGFKMKQIITGLLCSCMIFAPCSNLAVVYGAQEYNESTVKEPVTATDSDGKYQVLMNHELLNANDIYNLEAAINYAKYVKLQWNMDGDYFYNIYRAEAGGSFISMSQQSSGKVYFDLTAEKGKTYQYRVAAVIGGRESVGETITVKVSNGEILIPHQVLTTSQSGKLKIEFQNFDVNPSGTWKSLNTDILRVSPIGSINVQGRGTATVVFTTDAGYSVRGEVLCIDDIKAPSSSLYSTKEWQVMMLVNKYRMEEGEEPLTMVPKLKSAANIRKKELQKKYAHVRPDNSSYSTAFTEAGYKFTYPIGENIARGQTTSGQVMDGWMNSSGHRNNILRPNFVHFAPGESSNHWVQLFTGCRDEFNHMELILPKSLSFKTGTAIEDFKVVVALHCNEHGVSYLPLIEEMCDGYDENELGEQDITVTYGSFTEEFTVTLKKSATGNNGGSGGSGGSGGGSGGSGGSGGGGTGGSGGSGGGGGSTGGSSGSWRLDQHGWWYQNAGGSYPANVWKEINQAWYWFDASGYMASGWRNIQNQWYYLQPGGAMLGNNWLQYQGQWYYFQGSGAMVTADWVLSNNEWYYLNQDGVMHTGWLMYNQDWYYLDGSGKMLKNTAVTGADSSYWLDESGKMR